MSKDRPPSFQFYPRDFESDPNVICMSPEAVGGYVHLLCAAWLGDEPGYLRDDDEVLASLSRLGDRWPEVRKQVVRAFDLEIRPGWLVQKRMVEERDEQEARYRSAVAGGKNSWSGASREKRERRAQEAASRVP